MDVEIPAGLGIEKIEGYRARAEYSDIIMGYYRQGLEVRDPPQVMGFGQGGAPVEITPDTPTELHPRAVAFKWWCDGTWHDGGRAGVQFAKKEVRYTKKYVVALFWTSIDDGEEWNTAITFHFRGELRKGGEPRGAIFQDT